MIIKHSQGDVPCVGIIRFNVFVHKLLSDGSVDPEMLDCTQEFDECGASNVAEIRIEGFNKSDCVNKVKKLLESLEHDS